MVQCLPFYVPHCQYNTRRIFETLSPSFPESPLKRLVSTSTPLQSPVVFLAEVVGQGLGVGGIKTSERDCSGEGLKLWWSWMVMGRAVPTDVPTALAIKELMSILSPVLVPARVDAESWLGLGSVRTCHSLYKRKKK